VEEVLELLETTALLDLEQAGKAIMEAPGLVIQLFRFLLEAAVVVLMQLQERAEQHLLQVGALVVMEPQAPFRVPR